jgi:hypothetical protein
LASTLAACGGGKKGASPSRSAAANQDQGSSSGGASSGDEGDGKPVATASSSGNRVRLDVLSLRRTSANTLTLRFATQNVSTSDVNNFDTYADRDLSNKDNRSVDGVYLIDEAARKKYLVQRDAEGHCLCSRDIGDQGANARLVWFARFPAPPPAVKEVTLVVPNFAPIERIRISG